MGDNVDSKLQTAEELVALRAMRPLHITKVLLEHIDIREQQLRIALAALQTIRANPNERDRIIAWAFEAELEINELGGAPSDDVQRE